MGGGSLKAKKLYCETGGGRGGGLFFNPVGSWLL